MNAYSVYRRWARLLTSSRRDQLRRRRWTELCTQVESLESLVLLSGTLEVTDGALGGVHGFDVDGNELFGIRLPSAEETGEISAPSPSAQGPFPYEDTFKLHSLPGATKTIYLDFDGHVTASNTIWSNRVNPGQPIVTPAFSIDADTSNFSNADLDRIQNIYLRIAEDFAAFGVDVTTEEPVLDDLIRSNAADDRFGIRVAIGGSWRDWFDRAAGGVAFVGSFRWNTDTPTYVFEDSLGSGEKNTAEASSHEIGHTVGLSHDGKTDGTTYYPGHGTGVTGWAPIMGVGYGKQLVTWSKGEYADANRLQDDLAIITASNNGFGYRVDDYGDDIAGATSIIPSVTAGVQQIDIDGIIERNTDADVIEIEFGDGQVDLTFTATGYSPNLDIEAMLLDEAGNLVASSNPDDALNAQISATVTAGTYYVVVDGVGKGDPLALGYTDYSSLGQYNISGSGNEFIRGLISGTLFNDLNGDGNQDLLAGEAGIAGRVVFMDTNGNGIHDSRKQREYGSPNVPLPVKDLDTLTSTIHVHGLSNELVDVNVSLFIQHEYTRDLDIFLIAPNGQRVELVSDEGGIGPGYINTRFDDQAADSIAAGRGPYTGVYRPAGSLAALNGIDPNGVWTLEITDDAVADIGSLRSWSLDIAAGNDEAYVLTDSTGVYKFSELQPGTYMVGTKLPAGWVQTSPVGGGTHTITLGGSDQRFDVDFGTKDDFSTVPLPKDDIFARANNGRTVILASDGSQFSARYAQAIGEWSGILPGGVDWLVGDFNNDGLEDLAGRSSTNGRWYVLLASANGFHAPQDWGGWSTVVAWQDVMVGDLDGDGRDDIMGRSSSGTWVGGLSTGSQFAMNLFGGFSTTVTWNDVRTADVNGDGRADIIARASSGRWVAGVSNGAQFAMKSFGVWSTAVTWSNIMTGDINGDGLTDVVGRASTGSWVGGLSTGSSFDPVYLGAWTKAQTWSDVALADFNGDGKDDLIGRAANGRVVVGTSTGTSFSFAIWATLSKNVSWTSAVGDFDGDGRDDVANFASTGSWYVSLSQGNTFATSRWGAWNASLNWDSLRSGNFV